jgi:hypothetical protein
MGYDGKYPMGISVLDHDGRRDTDGISWDFMMPFTERLATPAFQ